MGCGIARFGRAAILLYKQHIVQRYHYFCLQYDGNGTSWKQNRAEYSRFNLLCSAGRIFLL